MKIRQFGNDPEPSGDARRVALITGGAGGIGQETGAELARAGIAVAIADLDPQRAAAAATQLTGFGGEVVWVEMDVTEQSSVTRGIGEIGQRLGGIDILINCAGWDAAAALARSDESHWRRMIDVNLLGAVRVTHAVLGSMAGRKWGRVINVAGEAGRVGTAEQSLMSAANGGVIAFTKAIAREVAATGVTVNCVSPGPIATPMLDQLISQADNAVAMMASLSGQVPMGRLGQPQDVAPSIAFLASDQAAYITGQTLSVSGGMTMI
ncbi:MAG: SDR family oxidoreductase [Thermoleophilia bacterium]|nr:SDR family oxidoreductase [Thermoleophilia bacterium]